MKIKDETQIQLLIRAFREWNRVPVNRKGGWWVEDGVLVHDTRCWWRKWVLVARDVWLVAGNACLGG